jgi:hypothetical protein
VCQQPFVNSRFGLGQSNENPEFELFLKTSPEFVSTTSSQDSVDMIGHGLAIRRGMSRGGRREARRRSVVFIVVCLRLPKVRRDRVANQNGSPRPLYLRKNGRNRY